MKYIVRVIIEEHEGAYMCQLEEDIKIGEYPTLEKAREVRDFIAEGSN